MERDGATGPLPGTRAGVLGVVPCAGASTRMGRSKALLDARGRTFLERVVGALGEGGCAPVAVVVREGPDSGREAELAESLGARVLINPDPSDGPISSIRVALSALGAPARGMALLPVDHPLVETETVATLLRVFHREEPPAVVPRYRDRRGHPALFHHTLFPRLLDPALEGGARTVVRELGPDLLEVPVEDPGVLRDIDLPREYREVFGEEPR